MLHSTSRAIMTTVATVTGRSNGVGYFLYNNCANLKMITVLQMTTIVMKNSFIMFPTLLCNELANVTRDNDDGNRTCNRR